MRTRAWREERMRLPKVHITMRQVSEEKRKKKYGAKAKDVVFIPDSISG